MIPIPATGSDQHPGRHTCPVCGYDELPDQPYLLDGTPSYEICECCGFQFGYTDDNSGYTFEAWRQKWIDAGMPWDWGMREDGRPVGWDPVAQLRRLRS